MKTVQINQILDTGIQFNEAAKERFGGEALLPRMTAAGPEAVHVANAYDIFVSGLNGVETSPKMPGSRLLPIGPNQDKFTEAIGLAFGFPYETSAGVGVYPGIILDRTNAREVLMTYLGTRFDKLNPLDIELTDLQPGLLRKISSLQAKGTGSLESHDRAGAAVAREFGHSVLAQAGVLKPSLLNGEHKTHAWSERPGGIAGAVTKSDREDDSIALYDIVLPNGEIREIREITTRLQAGAFLIDHPSFHAVDLNPEGVREFTSGLGILAINSQMNERAEEATTEAASSKVTKAILQAMDRL